MSFKIAHTLRITLRVFFNANVKCGNMARGISILLKRESNFNCERKYDIWIQYCIVLEPALRAIFHIDNLTY
jgi:hypothetical protein